MAKRDPFGEPKNPLQSGLAHQVTNPSTQQQSDSSAPHALSETNAIQQPDASRPTREDPPRDRRVLMTDSEFRQMDDLVRELEIKMRLTKLPFSVVDRALWRILLREVQTKLGSVEPPHGLKVPVQTDKAAVAAFEAAVMDYVSDLLLVNQ